MYFIEERGRDFNLLDEFYLVLTSYTVFEIRENVLRGLDTWLRKSSLFNRLV